MFEHVVRALILVLLVCVGVRIGAWLIAPVLPALGVLVVLIGIFWWLLGGARSGH